MKVKTPTAFRLTNEEKMALAWAKREGLFLSRTAGVRHYLKPLVRKYRAYLAAK